MSNVDDDRMGPSRYDDINNDDLLDLDDGSDRTDFSFAEFNEPLEEDDDVTLPQVYMASESVSPASTPDRRFRNSKYKPSSINEFPNSTPKHNIAASPQKFISSSKEIDGPSSSGEAKSSAVIRAEKLRSTLEPGYPSFVKSLVRSHVASCFWMGFPGLFCKRYLPNKDVTVILEDEAGKELKAKYIACKQGLSSGWRHFSVGHKLMEGDTLVFQLVEPARFKVYIIRAKVSTEMDGALPCRNLEVNTLAKKNMRGKKNGLGIFAYDTSKRKCSKSFLDASQRKDKAVSKLTPAFQQSVQESEYDSEEQSSEVLDDLRSSISFIEVENFENFRILINGVAVDSEFTDEVRRKYYELCCSQRVFLHDNLIKGISPVFVVGAITETVYIADAIKSCNLNTPRDVYTKWDKTLVAFQHLGMNVQFLRLRLSRIVSLAFESEEAIETRTYIEARREKARAVDEITNIEAKFETLKGAFDGFGAYVQSLKSKTESFQLEFNSEVEAPW